MQTKVRGLAFLAGTVRMCVSPLLPLSYNFKGGLQPIPGLPLWWIFPYILNGAQTDRLHYFKSGVLKPQPTEPHHLAHRDSQNLMVGGVVAMLIAASLLPHFQAIGYPMNQIAWSCALDLECWAAGRWHGTWSGCTKLSRGSVETIQEHGIEKNGVGPDSGTEGQDSTGLSPAMWGPWISPVPHI